MHLLRFPFDQIDVSHLHALCEQRIQEGLYLEFKREPYGRKDADKRELLKDISSFANSSGGHLIIGISQTDEGLAQKLIPSQLNPDQELQWLESTLRDSIEPRINGLRLKSLEYNGGHLIIVRIPKSYTPPHRVSALGISRFYGRNSAGAYELSVDELRHIFHHGGDMIHRIKKFRENRVAAIHAGDTPIEMTTDTGKLIISMVPLSAFGLPESVDLELAFKNPAQFRPMGAMNYIPRLNFDGLLVSQNDKPNPRYVQVFRNGTVEAVNCGIVKQLDGKRIVPSVALEEMIISSVPSYMAGLNALSISTPIIVMISLIGIHDAIFGVKSSIYSGDEVQSFDRSNYLLPEIEIESFREPREYQPLLRPALDSLWNGAGYVKSQNFDSDGYWKKS